MAHFTGIDKIALHTPDFQVDSLQNGQFSIDTGIKQGGKNPPYLLTDRGGRKVEAWKAHHNSQAANYTINQYGLLVSFNPSKMHHPYKLFTTETEQYQESVNRVKNELKDIGIHVNIDAMKPTRIDIAAQCEMNYPTHQYNSAYQLLKGKRMPNQRQYEGGYLIANKSNQVIFYDKRKELQHQKIDAIMQGEKNLLRCEMRATKSDAVASIIHVNTFQDFSRMQGYDIDNIYKAYLNRRIFSRQYLSEQIEIDYPSELNILQSIMKAKPRGAWKDYIAELNIDTLLIKFGNIDTFGQFLTDAGYSREQAYRIKVQLREMMQRKSLNDTKRGAVTTSTLLSELQEKFAA